MTNWLRFQLLLCWKGQKVTWNILEKWSEVLNTCWQFVKHVWSDVREEIDDDDEKEDEELEDTVKDEVEMTEPTIYEDIEEYVEHQRLYRKYKRDCWCYFCKWCDERLEAHNKSFPN